MKSMAFVVFVGVVGFVGFIQATDYCSSTVCGAGVTNIGCKNTGAFASTCPAGRVMVTMTTALKNAIVKSHNTKRNTLAAGNLPNFKPAIKMATMRWNNELALLASYNAKRCTFSHDACHNTDFFKFSGQNIAKTWWSGGPSPTDISVILPQINSWWSEYKQTTTADINSYPADPTDVIGHFTVMTAGMNTAVGCAGIRFKDPTMDNWDSLTLVCNYARTNIIDRFLYITGPTASACKTGTNPSFPALCSLSEPFNINYV